MKRLHTLLGVFTLSALMGCTSNTIPGNNSTMGAGSGTPIQKPNTTAINNATVATASNFGKSLFKQAVDQRCHSEIESYSAWRVAKTALGNEQATAMENRVCDCVSEQAPQQVSLSDMANAAIDTNYRTQLVAKVVANSIKSCYSSIIS